jgi:hypothetical protein
MLRRVLVCLAFATCCFLNTWVEFAEGESAHYARYYPLDTVAGPVVCWEILIALGMLGVWEFCRLRPRRLALPVHRLFLACCFVPLGIVSVALLRASPVDLQPVVRRPLFWPIALIVVAVPVGFAAMRPAQASRFLRNVFLYSCPVLALVLFQACHRTLLKYPRAAYADGPLAPAVKSPRSQIRVVWIIFDELSQTIAFSERPSSLHLPNLDRLRTESFYATAAEPPADSTERSMPALILGEKVLQSLSQGPGDLRVRTSSRAELFALNSIPNIFDSARELGFGTALVGWFHPYGRLLNRSLTKCYWTAGWLLSGVEEEFQPKSIGSALWDRVKFQAAALPLTGHIPGVFPGVYWREEKTKRFEYLLDQAQAIMADPSIGLALIHLPAPHPPAIYSRSKATLTTEGRIGYLDSVALVDRTLGELRQTLERAGMWDRTALVVSADHSWRIPLWRGEPEWTAEEETVSQRVTTGVPFLLKLPGHTTGIVYGKPFNTVLTRQIITEILSERLTDPARLPEFIDSR